MKIKNSKYNTRYISKRMYYSSNVNNKRNIDDKKLIKIGAFVVSVAGLAAGIIHFSSGDSLDIPNKIIQSQGYGEGVSTDNNEDSNKQDVFVEGPSDYVVEPVLAAAPAPILSTVSEPVLENVVNNNIEETTEQEYEKKYLRTTKKVNIRSNCDSSNKDSVIETLESGVILEFSKDLNNGWYEVLYNNRYAYINASYVEKVSIENRDDDRVVIIDGSNVNIRKEATASSKSLGTMQYGDCFSYIGTMPNGWYKIAYNGGTGYVSNAFSCLENAGLKYESVTSVTPTGNNVNVRDQASTRGRVINTLDKGDTLQYTRKLDNGWYEVLMNGHPGYVSGKYVKEGTRVMITNKSYAIVAAERATNIYRDSEFTTPIALMPQYETGHVYEAGRDYYLINAEQGIGYIKKSDARRLDSTCVVVDEGDQITRAFRKGAPFFYADCTTGKPSTPTDKGIHQIEKILYNYYMDKWDVTVNVYMPFCRDQAFHGIKDVGGKKDIASVVGASVRESKRSHGCVREYDEDALFLSQNVEVGTDVVVKR